MVDEDDCSLAIERAIDIQPQLLLVDWTGEHCGAELIQALRATRFGQSLYLIALLDSEKDSLLQEAAAVGVDDFLVRPLYRRSLALRLRSGRRTMTLQRELEREREELRHFAAELAISNRRLQEAAMTDSLTGIPNRRYAIERMQMEWLSCARHNRPLSVMIVDLDGFKEVNDRHGHDHGDAILRAVAGRLRDAVRDGDTVARLGGDEFLVLLDDLQEPSACDAVAAKLLDLIAEPVPYCDATLRVTASIGAAVFPADGDDGAGLLRKADRAMYEAKHAGRNAFRRAGSRAAPEPG